MRRNKELNIFNVVNSVLMIILCIVFIYPFIYTLAISLSGPKPIMEGRVFLYPLEFTLSAYRAIFKDKSMITSLIFTINMTLFGVIGSIIATTITAYPLSKNDLKGKNGILNLIVFTMYFSGGLIPTYFVVKGVGLLDNMGALILPNLINTFFLFIMINYFRGLPAEMEESAKLDGANDLRILVNIIIPLSMPIIATLTIFYAVSYWNTFFNALIYMQSSKHYPLQIKLYMLLNNADTVNSADSYNAQLVPENLKGAIIIVTALPILIVYPFLQKYFVKGATIGAIKG